MTDNPADTLRNAVATIEAFYSWVDMIEESGGATTISGVAKCHAFLKSMKTNRDRVEKLVLKPARTVVATLERS